MTHLPYVAAAYGLCLLLLLGLAIGAWLRLRAVRRVLSAIDPRERRGGAE
jgi:heme exporter protein CcmD